MAASAIPLLVAHRTFWASGFIVTLPIRAPATQARRARWTFQKNASNRKAIALIAGTGALITYAAVLTAVGKIYTWPISGYPTFRGH